MEDEIILIKLGGSLITDKRVANSVKKDQLNQLLVELKEAMKMYPQTQFILGHGSGSFAHYPASKYGTAHGFRDEHSAYGMAVTQDSAAQLNRIIIQHALEKEIPAISFYVSNTIVTEKESLKSFYLDPLLTYLDNRLIPIITGDVIADTQQGCTIWSADTILPFIGLQLLKQGKKIKQLLHVTQTSGVWKNPEGEQDGIFEIINSSNLNEVKNSIGSTRGVDVTGGMWTKIEEAYRLASQGIPSQIITGEKSGNMLKALAGEKIGTSIHK